MQLARRGAAIRPMRHAVDHHAARSADPFAAIGVERNRILALGDEALIDDVEHLEERHVRIGLGGVVHQPSRLRRGSLPPDFQLYANGWHRIGLWAPGSRLW